MNFANLTPATIFHQFSAAIDVCSEFGKLMVSGLSSAIVFPEALLKRPDVSVKIIFPSLDLLRFYPYIMLPSSVNSLNFSQNFCKLKKKNFSLAYLAFPNQREGLGTIKMRFCFCTVNFKWIFALLGADSIYLRLNRNRTNNCSKRSSDGRKK